MASETPNDTQSVEVPTDDDGTGAVRGRLSKSFCVIQDDAFDSRAAEARSDPLRGARAAMWRASLRAA